MTDMHVHTGFSCDSHVSMDDYCRKALASSVGCLCFTDHVDHNPADDGYNYYNAEKYFEEFEKVKNRYTGQLMLLTGIEFSEPHIYPRQLEEYRKLPYDFILGSVHFWIDNYFASELVLNDYPVADAFEQYWEHVLKAVRHGGFDSLAHLDFPKRYYKQNIWQKEMLERIFSVMAEKNMALEINTSTLRQGLDETMPGKDLLDLFEQCGGRYITIGGDSHSLSHLAHSYDKALSLITGQLQNTIYINHTPSAV